MREPAEKPDTELPVTSSVPEELPPEQQALFREVLALFEKEQLPYAVSGGFAMQEHTGICRFTKDLDIFLSPADASKALFLLGERGFACEVSDPVWLAKAHRDGYFVDLITGMSNGAITVDRSWIERSRPATIVGVESAILASEELIASKLFVTRRERFDGADIAHIVFALRGPGPRIGGRALGTRTLAPVAVSLCLPSPERVCPEACVERLAFSPFERDWFAGSAGTIPRQLDRPANICYRRRRIWSG